MSRARLAQYIRVLRAQGCRELLQRRFCAAETTYRQLATLERRYLAGAEGPARKACAVRVWHAEAMAAEMRQRWRGEPVTYPKPAPRNKLVEFPRRPFPNREPGLAAIRAWHAARKAAKQGGQEPPPDGG